MKTTKKALFLARLLGQDIIDDFFRALRQKQGL